MDRFDTLDGSLQRFRDRFRIAIEQRFDVIDSGTLESLAELGLEFGRRLTGPSPEQLPDRRFAIPLVRWPDPFARLVGVGLLSGVGCLLVVGRSVVGRVLRVPVGFGRRFRFTGEFALPVLVQPVGDEEIDRRSRGRNGVGVERRSR